MKSLSTLPLLCAFTAFCCASCSKGPGNDPEPVADAADSQDQVDQNSTSSGPGTQTHKTTTNPLIDRIRLPDMEKLPNDKELTANQPEDGRGGVIARPPSD